jgi:hypothetical protein
MMHFQVKYTGCGFVWHIARLHWLWYLLYGTTTNVFHLAIFMRYHNGVFHLAMCHTVPRTVQPSNMTNGITTSVFPLAMCHMDWLWYCMTHCQVKCTGRGTIWHIARGNTLVVIPFVILLGCTVRGTVWHIARWKTPLWYRKKIARWNTLPVYFTWQYSMRYHDQCNLAMCYTVPQPVYFTWQCVMRYHDQCNQLMCHVVPQPVYFLCQVKYTGRGTA